MDTLLADLFRAYYDARRNKRRTASQLRFEMNMERNLIDLNHELKNRTYRPSPSICFIIEDPVKREVFASDFRDRVVHHLYYNYVSPVFERRFIFDSYSCRKSKGTLHGIERLEHHIRSVSRNYTRPAYILKLDVQGYFMSINRERLRGMVRSVLLGTQTARLRMKCSLDFVLWLTDIITLKNPLYGCRRCGDIREWDDLPDSKSLFKQQDGVGLPIGDLTSQLFSYIFLGRLDWYVVHTMGFPHYGRYVDDFYLIDTDKERLQKAVPLIRDFLKSELGLTLHPKKIRLQSASLPIHFLGAVVYPYYRHISSRTTRKFRSVVDRLKPVLLSADSSEEQKEVMQILNSYFGYFSHAKACRFVESILQPVLTP